MLPYERDDLRVENSASKDTNCGFSLEKEEYTITYVPRYVLR